jgi:hypothetical protein
VHPKNLSPIRPALPRLVLSPQAPSCSPSLPGAARASPLSHASVTCVARAGQCSSSTAAPSRAHHLSFRPEPLISEHRPTFAGSLHSLAPLCTSPEQRRPSPAPLLLSPELCAEPGVFAIEQQPGRRRPALYCDLSETFIRCALYFLLGCT